MQPIGHLSNAYLDACVVGILADRILKFLLAYTAAKSVLQPCDPLQYWLPSALCRGLEKVVGTKRGSRCCKQGCLRVRSAQL